MVETRAVEGIRENSEVGEMVREMRAARGWSLRQLAGRAGVSHSWIGNLEGGPPAKLDIGMLGRVADALGVSVEYLYRVDGDKAGEEARANAIAQQWLGLSEGGRKQAQDYIRFLEGQEKA